MCFVGYFWFGMPFKAIIWTHIHTSLFMEHEALVIKVRTHTQRMIDVFIAAIEEAWFYIKQMAHSHLYNSPLEIVVQDINYTVLCGFALHSFGFVGCIPPDEDKYTFCCTHRNSMKTWRKPKISVLCFWNCTKIFNIKFGKHKAKAIVI